MSMMSDSIVFSVDYGNETKEYEIENEMFLEYGALAFGGDAGEANQAEMDILMSHVMQDENMDFASEIVDSIFDSPLAKQDISYSNLENILDGKTLDATQALGDVTISEDGISAYDGESVIDYVAEADEGEDAELTPNAGEDAELTPNAGEETIDETTEYPTRVGTYSETIIPDVMVREKTSGQAYIDREYKAALEDYYNIAVEDNSEAQALEEILTTLGFDEATDFIKVIMERADEAGMDYLEYLYSFDGAMTSAGQYDKGVADGHLSGSEIALSSFMDEDGYNVEDFIEAYDALSIDDRNKMISSLLYVEGHDSGGNPIKGMTAEEAAEFLFGTTTGTVDFGSATQI